MNLSSIQEGIISELDHKKQMAIVVCDGRSSDWLKILSTATKNKRHSLSLKIKDQVLVLNPNGSNGNGYILAGIYSNEITPPKSSSKNKEITEYSDGTIITFDLDKKTLEVDSKSSITINCKTATIKAKNILLDSPNINLGKGGQGVVTGATICPFTKAPHTGASSSVKATA